MLFISGNVWALLTKWSKDFLKTEKDCSINNMTLQRMDTRFKVESGPKMDPWGAP